MTSENETVEEIVKEMRGEWAQVYFSEGSRRNDGEYCDNEFAAIEPGTVADRIESAWRREKAQVMQEATEVAMAPTQVQYEPRPKRNCDRFANSRDAYKAFSEWQSKREQIGDCKGIAKGRCPTCNEQKMSCFENWLFAPVAEGGES